MQEEDCNAQFLEYRNTGYFSKTAIDYIEQKKELQSFFEYETNEAGIERSILARKDFPANNRKILVQELQQQYSGIQSTNLVKENIELLQKENTYTVTTAHQPNIFSGPLYTTYKILHTVKLAQHLTQKYPDKNFVPVFYMGSEDADLDELNNISINGKKYIWNTSQTGTVGRMTVDKKLLTLIEEIQGQIGVEAYGNEWVELLKNAYQSGRNIQDATLVFLNSLFGKYGLVILNPDNANLKKLFEPVVIKELQEQFSHKALQKTIVQLEEKGYHAQAAGREINLFYLIDDKRERIEKEGASFVVRGLELQFSLEEILEEVKNYPDRFSGNVVLRGPFQETILPNIAFIGGGGELAYWLELKNVFREIGVPYPMLLVRNSFLLFNERQKATFDKLHIGVEALFKKEFEILNNILVNRQQNISIENEAEQLKSVYAMLKEKAAKADITLAYHAASLQTQALRKITQLAKKIASAQRKQLSTEQTQVSRLKKELFPNSSLQERTENMAGFYAKYGSGILDDILSHSLAIERKFGILFL